MKRIVLSSLVLVFVGLLVACDLPRESKPSVLVIAVEGLGFEKINCDTDESAMRAEPSALNALCQESIRFSHAYAPSTMSQATLASLLTGLYPFDHGVRHNGSDFLSARFRTSAEAALSRGYHTIFISGGAPIWRKSGLAQGFEIFEDNVDVAPDNFYRSAGEVFRILTNWVDSEVAGKPVFSFMYLADLQFPNVATVTKEGELREKSINGQLEEINESLGDLFKWLRQRRRWNSTNIILVGLNSIEHRENEDPPPLSLKSASVQVSLMIKPARKEADNVIQWGIDRNISLVDIGYTLFQILGQDPPITSIASLKPESLLTALSQPEPHWEEDRLILTETAWPDWLEGAGIRWAIRQNQFLYIHDTTPQIFNTLTDRLENYTLKPNDPLWTSVNSGVMALVASAQTPAFNGMRSQWPDQIQMARNLWVSGVQPTRVKGDEPWAKWILQRALMLRDWRELKRLSQEMGDPLGAFVAARQLGETLPVPRDPCVRLFLSTKGDKKAFESECQDERLLALHSWQQAKGDDERLLAQERFIRIYNQSRVDQEIGRANFLNDLRWDANRSWPEPPSALDYLLTLKEFEPYAKKLAASLGSKNFRL